MNNQDVINFLNQVRKILLDDRSWLESTIQPINEAFDMAISAMEKQIPKRAVGEHYAHMRCPSCNHRIPSGAGSSSRRRDNWCNYCGQAIDWEGD